MACNHMISKRKASSRKGPDYEMEALSWEETIRIMLQDGGGDRRTEGSRAFFDPRSNLWYRTFRPAETV
jgi:hypothetical protein